MSSVNRYSMYLKIGIFLSAATPLFYAQPGFPQTALWENVQATGFSQDTPVTRHPLAPDLPQFQRKDTQNPSSIPAQGEQGIYWWTTDLTQSHDILFRFQLQKNPVKTAIIYRYRNTLDYVMLRGKENLVVYSALLDKQHLLPWQSGVRPKNTGASEMFYLAGDRLWFKSEHIIHSVVDSPRQLGVEITTPTHALYLPGNIQTKQGHLTDLSKHHYANLTVESEESD